jgi:fucose permease
MWKIDLHLVPSLCLLYILAFLDRVNIANARLFSLEKDLHLTGNQYNICLVIFFVPYVIFEIPANYLLKKFRPSVWRMTPTPNPYLPNKEQNAND